MSKWNKPNAQPLTQEFIQNQERRKQMIIEAAKRRKQKQKKLQEQQEIKKKDQEQALIRHKQEKKDAYIKYLRNNMYDKYEEAKRQKKEASSEIKPMGKWKKKSAEKEENDNQLQALDLEVKVEKQSNTQIEDLPKKNQSNNSVNNTRKKLNEEFEKQWQFQIDVKDDLLSSKLLDSLDLDVGTLNRDYQMKELIKEKKKTEPKVQEKPNEIMELRDLIGYQSIVITQNAKKTNLEVQKVENKPKNMVKKPQVDEVEILNELKHKKQAKIMVWAIQEEQDAQDLFSQCSSVNRKKQPKALKELNQEIKNKKAINNNKKALETIKEVAREKIASRERKTNSIQVHKQQSKPSQIAKDQRASSKQKVVQKQPEPHQSRSIEKRANTTTVSNPAFPKKQQKQQQKKQPSKTISGFSSEKNIIRVKSTSQQKKRESPVQQKPLVKPISTKQELTKVSSKPQQPKKFGNLPPLPAVMKGENNSIATHDMQIDVQSFIKQDLINLNEQEMQLQQQLKILHKNNRNTLKEVYSKYEIKNDYGNSAEITGDNSRPKQYKYNQNQVDIEDSIQNLDNYLIRRDLESKGQNRTIPQENQENSKSLINPFSNSEDLCNQILKLAKNISRFEKKPAAEDPNGYNYMNKMKRNNSGNKVSEVSRVTKDSKKDKDKEKQEEFLSESHEVSQIRGEPLQRPPFIFDASEISSQYRNEEQKVQKIHVNTKLLKGLLLDDD